MRILALFVFHVDKNVFFALSHKLRHRQNTDKCQLFDLLYLCCCWGFCTSFFSRQSKAMWWKCTFSTLVGLWLLSTSHIACLFSSPVFFFNLLLHLICRLCTRTTHLLRVKSNNRTKAKYVSSFNKHGTEAEDVSSFDKYGYRRYRVVNMWERNSFTLHAHRNSVYFFMCCEYTQQPTHLVDG